jgi:hypothetical protein
MISPNIEATITLDRADARFTPGETVTGLVRYRAEKPAKVKDVTVVAAWETSGKGDTDKESTEPVIIAGAQELLGAGELPFELTLPLAPLSYHGTLIKVSWVVRVRFNRPWAIDAKADHPIEVV